MQIDKLKFIQQNSPDGGFLQSEEWRKFQASTGKKTFHVEGENFWANIMEHQLPIVGKYFYIPRGPIASVATEEISNSKNQISNKLQNFKFQIKKLADLAKKEKAGWIRIDEPLGHQMSKYKILKAPHDVQPKELFIIDIAKTEDELLAEMKAKTRYNIKVAEKKGVTVISKQGSENNKYLEDFLRLVKITAERQGVNFHAEDYYRQMFAAIPDENIKLYCAEFEGEIIAANLVIFFGDTVTYLHGASDDKFRNVMAPYLLQWQQIKDAKKFGATRYDFGGVKINSQENNWAGITRFKLSFSPNTKPTEFLGSYDIIINPVKYYVYRLIQKVKSFL